MAAETTGPVAHHFNNMGQQQATVRMGMWVFLASWRKTRVSAAQWKQLRDELASEAHRWLETLKKPREIDPSELNSVVGSVAHLAYHVGAIRQIDLSARGPSADG